MLIGKLMHYCVANVFHCSKLDCAKSVLYFSESSLPSSYNIYIHIGDVVTLTILTIPAGVVECHDQ